MVCFSELRITGMSHKLTESSDLEEFFLIDTFLRNVQEHRLHHRMLGQPSSLLLKLNISVHLIKVHRRVIQLRFIVNFIGTENINNRK